MPTGVQRCPSVERLQGLIKAFNSYELSVVKGKNTDINAEEQEEVVDALEWLKDFLLNRRGYQRKQQIKRQALFAMAREHGLLDEVEERVDAMFSDKDYDDVINDDVSRILNAPDAPGEDDE